MRLELQEITSGWFGHASATVATPWCNTAWHHAEMATDEERAAAEAELDALTAEYREHEGVTKKLHAAIVKHLKAKTLRPTEVVEHVPFTAVHVGRIARAGGVPLLREPTVVSKRKAGK